MKKRIAVITIIISFTLILHEPLNTFLQLSAVATAKVNSSDLSEITLPQMESISLPYNIHDNNKAEKLILSKETKYILDDGYYETDSWLKQDYSSMTPDCPKLAAIEVSEESDFFTVKDDVLYSKDMTALIYCPPGKKGELIIPEGVTEIGFMAFQECEGLTSIQLPSSLKYIKEAAFGGNTDLTALTVSEENPYFKAVDNVLFSKYGEELVAYAGGKPEKSYTLPDGVQFIRNAAFMGNVRLEEVYACKNLMAVGNEAFRNCSRLKKVHFEEGIHELWGGAFIDCSNLSEMNFPEGLRSIYYDVFTGCNKLLDISLPSSIQNVKYELGSVAGRKITCRNPYYVDFYEGKALEAGMTFLVYRGTYIAELLKGRDQTINYFKENYTDIKPVAKVPKTVMKGKGKADTGWYDKTKKTFLITNPDQLAGLAKLVNSGNSFKGKTIQLMKDLDLSCYENWTPIGCKSEASGALKSFAGTFEGNGHIIYNLKVIGTRGYYFGLFGINKGTIKNLTLKNAQVFGPIAAGIIIGANYGQLTGCSVSGSVFGNEASGGITGSNYKGITNCIVNVDVHGNKSVGGIAGNNGGTKAVILGCTGTGNIIGDLNTGGILGQANSGSIINCVNRMRVHGDTNTGGIIGEIRSDAVITECINTADISGCDRIGGIAGNYDGGTIEGCRNNGNVTGVYYTGGIAGYLTAGTLTASSNFGQVSGYYAIGGILGISSVNPGHKRITECTNQGSAEGSFYTDPVTGKDLNLPGLPHLTGE